MTNSIINDDELKVEQARNLISDIDLCNNPSFYGISQRNTIQYVKERGKINMGSSFQKSR